MQDGALKHGFHVLHLRGVRAGDKAEIAKQGSAGKRKSFYDCELTVCALRLIQDLGCSASLIWLLSLLSRFDGLFEFCFDSIIFFTFKSLL